MLNRDRPLGQRRGDGHCFGTPPMTMPVLNFATKRGPAHHASVVLAPLRASNRDSVTRKRAAGGWIDSRGLPYGRSGDKLARKAMKKTLTKSVIR